MKKRVEDVIPMNAMNGINISMKVFEVQVESIKKKYVQELL